MKQTKLLLLPFVLSYSFLAKAQEEPLPSKPVEAKIHGIEEALRKSANPRYMVLEDVTPVYHQPADTVNSRRVFKLFPGTRVYIRDYVPGGFLIDLGFVDGERYYLPAKSVKGLQTFVEI